MRDLQLERTTELTAAKSLLARCKSADRDPTDAEQQVLQGHLDAVATLDRQIKGRALVQSVTSLGSSETVYDGSDGVFSAKDGKDLVSAIRSKGRGRGEVSTKAALGSTTLLPTAGSLAAPGLYPNAAYAFAGLFQNLPADGPTQRIYTFGGATAGVVAEGAVKPPSGLVVTASDIAMVKIATTVGYTTEFAEDAPFLLSHLASELTSAVAVAENASILTTFGTTSGILTGTGTTVTAIDVIASAIASAEALNGVTPNAVIVNPAVLGVLRAVKASTAGSYVLDPLLAGPTTIHGVPVVSSAATPAGTAWLVSSGGVVIYRRGALQVEVGTNGTDFISNTETMRVEERFATAVIRPSMLTKLTLT